MLRGLERMVSKRTASAAVAGLGGPAPQVRSPPGNGGGGTGLEIEIGTSRVQDGFPLGSLGKPKVPQKQTPTKPSTRIPQSWLWQSEAGFCGHTRHGVKDRMQLRWSLPQIVRFSESLCSGDVIHSISQGRSLFARAEAKHS